MATPIVDAADDWHGSTRSQWFGDARSLVSIARRTLAPPQEATLANAATQQPTRRFTRSPAMAGDRHIGERD
jgi:hypothetical protein